MNSTNLRFRNQVVLVTGATRGVGAATARQFAEGGAHVYLTGRSEVAGQQIAEEITTSGGSASFHRLDVTSEGSWQTLVAAIEHQHGRLDTLVNNAGVHQTQSLLESTEEDFYQQVNTNLKGVFLGCRQALPLMTAGLSADQYGNIVNVSSIAGLVGTASQSLYSMTKGGLQLFSKSLALELAPARIRVNCINPGMIENDMGSHLVEQLVSTGVFPDEEKARHYLHRQIPMRRFASVDEVAAAITFLASDAASFITGVGLPIDGGLTAG